MMKLGAKRTASRLEIVGNELRLVTTPEKFDMHDLRAEMNKATFEGEDRVPEPAALPPKVWPYRELPRPVDWSSAAVITFAVVTVIFIGFLFVSAARHHETLADRCARQGMTTADLYKADGCVDSLGRLYAPPK